MGRPRDPNKLGMFSYLTFLNIVQDCKLLVFFFSFQVNPAARPTKMCPECRSIHDKNFDRHLNSHFDVSTRKGRQAKEKAKKEAAQRTVQGIRRSQVCLLPQAIRDLLKDPLTRFGFTQFLDHVGVSYPKEVDSISSY